MHWFFDPSFTMESVSVTDAEQKHFKALRIQPGEQVIVTNGLGASFGCEVVALAPILLKVVYFDQQEGLSQRFHLIQALAKNDRDELGMQTAVELGATEVTPWAASRSIVRWDGKAQKNQLRWQQIAIEAMKQSHQPWAPVIRALTPTKQLSADGLGIVLDPKANIGLKDLDLTAKRISIAVGPEGGVTDAEFEALEQSGFIRVRLGSSVLRTSSAGPAAIAGICSLGANWDKA